VCAGSIGEAVTGNVDEFEISNVVELTGNKLVTVLR
jgi:hypothetical protein